MVAKFIDCPEFLADLYTADMQDIVPDLDLRTGDPTPEDLTKLLADCRFLMNDHTKMNSDLLESCPNLKTVVFMGTGASSYIDLSAAHRLGIGVRTIRGYGDRSVAEHAIALMFAAGRKIVAMDRAIRGAQWQTLDSIEFFGKTLGVVGTGGIGAEMVKLGSALGMKVVAWNRSGISNHLPCKELSLDVLFAVADVVSLHLSLTDDTKGLISARRLALLDQNAILINTARAGLVDESALIEALRAGRISHAALDVFAEEPLARAHPLTDLDNVTLTAHAGFMTREASVRLLRMALEVMADEISLADTQ